MAPPPAVEILDKQPEWTWFMPWGNLVLWGNGVELIRNLFRDERVLTKEDISIDRDGNYRIAGHENKVME